MRKVLLFLVIILSEFNASGANDLRIFEIYGAGGNFGATYNQDFILLYNDNSTSSISLTGWSLQYATSTSTTATWDKLNLNGTISPKGFFLVAININSSTGVGTTGAAITNINQVWPFFQSGGIAAGNGKIALMSNTNVINTQSPVSPVDFVGYGTANASEGSAAPSPSTTQSIVRKNDGVDSDINSSDFILSGSAFPSNILIPTSISFPLKLSLFSIEIYFNQNLLLWQTTSESNFSHFEIQRSTDAKSFETIGNLKGKGSENEIVEYTFIDERPFEGLNYYRLKQVDLDNTFEFSKIVSVNVFRDEKLLVYPNPTAEKLKFTNVELEDINSVKIYNFAGKLLFDKHIESLEMDLTGISPQNLLIEINLKDNTSIKRRIVKL